MVVALLCCATSLWAQRESHRATVTLYFRHDKYLLDEGYMSNAATIQRLDDFVELHKDQIDSIEIIAHASPEGTVYYNQYLSERRSGTTKYWLLKRYKNLQLSQIREVPLGEDYAGLIELIEADPKVPYKKEVLNVLCNSKVHPDKKMRQLMKLRWGHPYAYIRRHHLPKLRTAATCVIYWSESVAVAAKPVRLNVVPDIRLPNRAFSPSLGSDEQMAPMLPTTSATPHLPTESFVSPAEGGRKTILALKTNALYDLATVVNFAVEVPLGDRFSLQYNHICPWWLSDNNQYCLQILAAGVEARWWFAPQPRVASDEGGVVRDRLVGHHLGAYGMSGKFDIQARTWGCYQGEFWSAGLSYGYSMPLGRRTNLEFSLSVGYARIPYRHYVPTSDWQDLIRDKYNSGVLHYIGPTKAEVSLVIPITVGHSTSKGGRR